MNCGNVITFTFFNLGSFSFLVCFKKPLEVIVFEFTDVLVLEFFSNLNRFIPTVKLLVHSHSFFNFIVLNQNSFSFVELFFKDCKLSLNSEVINALLSNQFIQLA